jgi:hypothetical protein
MKSKYQPGDVVYERIYPTKKMVIASYSDGLYYCKLVDSRDRKLLVYFERDLRPEITS